MSEHNRKFFEFGAFRLDVDRGRLLRAGEIIPLPPKAIALLLALLKHPGRLVEKEVLLETLWPNAIVEDSNLTQTVHILRKALGKYGDSLPRIETMPKLGYVLVGEVREVLGQDNELAVIPPAPPPESVDAEAAPAAPELTEKSPAEAERGIKILAAPRARLRSWLQSHAMRIAVVALAGVLLGLSFWVPEEGARAELESVAVLPFSSLDAKRDDPSLSLGIADALITKLGATRGIKVRPTAAIRGYLEKEIDPFEAGRQLGVEVVITGHTRYLNGRLSVTVQLLRVTDGQTLWSGKFEESSNQLFDLENAIAEQVNVALATLI